MTTASGRQMISNTGPMGPVAVSAALLLVATSPLLHGGNREVALIVLEAISLLLLLSVLLRIVFKSGSWEHCMPASRIERVLLALLLLSPAWLAFIYLVPFPIHFWSALPGRAVYTQLMAETAFPTPDTRVLSLIPSATKASLFAGIAVVAGFVAGFASRLSQLKSILAVVSGMAFIEILFGLLQASGGVSSRLYFDLEYSGRPLGTFGNPDHFANFVGMALAGYIWLAWQSLGERSDHAGEAMSAGFANRSAIQLLWGFGGFVMVLGVLMSFSRGAALSLLPTGMLATGVALLSTGRGPHLRLTLFVFSGATLAAVALVGVSALLSRFDLTQLSVDASGRSLMAASTLAGAKEFWPFGAGWGTYAYAYPRFQPIAVSGFVEHAHHDYAQMMLEGGVFSAILITAFLWLAILRVVMLIRVAAGPTSMTTEQMTSTLCGLGLMGFLLHSLAEFNMHIPANAILAALLAGAFLRPLRHSNSRHDRSA